MKATRRAVLIGVLALLCAPQWALAHEGHVEQGGAGPHAQLGSVRFLNSCSPAVQPRFDRAMALLHSFWANDAIEAFKAVLQQDPGCAIAYWGIAMSHQQNPLTGQPPPPKGAEQALDALDKAKAIGKATERERDYIAAIDLIYRDADKLEFRSRRLAYEKAMQALMQRYPDDPEAAIFYALALNMTTLLTDRTYANQLKAAAILQKLAEKQPDHPGVAHYLVHSYDYPSIADRGLPAARLYARIAPNHPHALHMPSHIFTRLGMWQDSIENNRRSVAAAKTEGNAQEQVHATDYLVHAHLQLGQDAEAKRIVDDIASIAGINRAIFIGPYAIAAMPARYVLERRAWKEAAALQPQPSPFPFTEANVHFARGLGLARTGNVAAAEKEVQALAARQDALEGQKNTYWAGQVEVQKRAVTAWIAWARGQRDEALRSMQAAADLEDSMEKHIVTPSPIVPARELFGEMLIEAKRPGEALTAFESSAQREPNRLRGLYGAAQAAALSGDRAKAKMYYAKLVELTAKGDGARQELEQARAYLAQR
jgi:predicted Zn-dependent protease